jgi:hypothetical protein
VNENGVKHMQYLVTYDLNKPLQNYTRLYSAIKALGSWIHALQNVWFVDTTYNAGQIRDSLKNVVDGNDKIFVTKTSGWASYNMSNQGDWLNGR